MSRPSFCGVFIFNILLKGESTRTQRQVDAQTSDHSVRPTRRMWCRCFPLPLSAPRCILLRSQRFQHSRDAQTARNSPLHSATAPYPCPRYFCGDEFYRSRMIQWNNMLRIRSHCFMLRILFHDWIKTCELACQNQYMFFLCPAI